MPVLAIPPHVPPRIGARRKRDATFGIDRMLMPEAVPFARAPMRAALDEHARLLHAHRHEILHAVVDDEAVKDAMPFLFVNGAVAVVAADDLGRCEVRGWYREDASWVVRRCHGIVRQLMAEPPAYRFYAVVVTGGVASLHVMAGTGEDPRPWDGRRGTWEGLGVRVVARDVLAEPWEQWHLRDGGVMRTWWRMPDGSLAEGAVPVPIRPRTLREAVDRALATNEDDIRAGLRWFERRFGGEPRIVLVRSSARRGDRVSVVPQMAHPICSRKGLPAIRRVLSRPVEGLDPVFVLFDHGGGVRWRSRGQPLDVAVPPPVNELRNDCGQD